MDAIFQFFKHIASTYGITFAVLFLLMMLILFGVYFIIKTFPDVIRDYIESKLADTRKAHINGAIKRKNISPVITKTLSDLIINTNGDRALLFEFSNGTSNLAGLPFLFVNATSESLSYNTTSVASLYQRINISLVANFIIELENENYIYASDIEEIKMKFPFIYNFMKPNNVKSLLFYSIYGIHDTLGFIVLTSTNDKTFTKKDALPWVAESVQQISSLLNFEGLDEKIER